MEKFRQYLCPTTCWVGMAIFLGSLVSQVFATLRFRKELITLEEVHLAAEHSLGLLAVVVDVLTGLFVHSLTIYLMGPNTTTLGGSLVGCALVASMVARRPRVKQS